VADDASKTRGSSGGAGLTASRAQELHARAAMIAKTGMGRTTCGFPQGIGLKS